MLVTNLQRRSSWRRPCPRGHILKSLALASRPQVLKNWPILGSRIALFLNCWNFADRLKKICFFAFAFFCWKTPEKNFWRLFFWGGGIAWKIFLKTFFSLENTCAGVLGLWPWPRAFLSLASGGSVLGRAVLGLGFFCILGLGLGFEPRAFDSTSANLYYYY